MVETLKNVWSLIHSLRKGDVDARMIPTKLESLANDLENKASHLGVQQKTWGLNQTNLCDGTLQVARCDINAFGYSSVHLHEHKANKFIVHSGVLEVRVWNDPGNETIDSTVNADAKHSDYLTYTLCDGDTIIVPPGVVHQFYALENTICSEVYWSKNNTKVGWNDIKRFTKNGQDDSDRKNYVVEGHGVTV